jgi:hypothetical protein
MRWKVVSLMLVILGGAAWVAAQPPDPVQIYRTIKQTSDARAGDVRWIEIWETRDGNSRQWVMVDLQGTPNGVESTCYHAVALGSGAPIYFVDDELVPVANVADLIETLANRRLLDQSLLYVEGYVDQFDEVEIIGQMSVAGIDSEQRRLIDQDAANLFLIKPPATSTADLWTATDGGYVTRYRFTADGSQGDVVHTYDLLPGGSIQPPSEVNMQCFPDGFPVAPQTAPLVTGSLTHSTFRSELTVDDLRDHYQEALTPAWEPIGNSPGGGRVFSQTLDSGSVCRLGLQFQPNPNGGTVMTARVNPDVVTEDTFASLPDYSSPVVIQTASNFTFSVDGGVQAALDQVLPDLEADGWVQRPELTDVRENSAFVTLQQGNVDTHVIVDSTGASATVRVQQRDPLCGPTFNVP